MVAGQYDRAISRISLCSFRQRQFLPQVFSKMSTNSCFIHVLSTSSKVLPFVYIFENTCGRNCRCLKEQSEIGNDSSYRRYSQKCRQIPVSSMCFRPLLKSCPLSPAIPNE